MNVLLANTCDILEMQVWLSLSEKPWAAEGMGMIGFFWPEEGKVEG